MTLTLLSLALRLHMFICYIFGNNFRNQFNARDVTVCKVLALLLANVISSLL